MIKLKVLPPMRCDVGCGKCCGPVPLSETEYQRVRRFMAKHNVRARDNGILTCPLYQDGRCAVYQARPTMCRVFGHVPKMSCPHGYNVNVDDRHVLRMLRSMGHATRMLHDLLDEP